MPTLRKARPLLLGTAVVWHFTFATSDGRAQESAEAHADANALGRYHALIIGVPEYDYFGPVSSAATDAHSLAKILQEDYGYEVVSLKPDAKDDDVRAALARLKSLPRSSHLLVYFSGHGEKGETPNGGYWLTKNSEQSEAARRDPVAARRAHWVSRDEVVATIQDMKATQVLVIDDSCYSGNTGLFDGPPQAVKPAVKQTAGSPSPPAVQYHGHEADAARQANSRRARIWLSASGGNEVASAGQGDQSSAFTRYFLDALRRNEMAVDALEFFVGIRRQMASTNETQVPEYHPLLKAGDAGGDFLFFKTSWSSDEVSLNLGRMSVRVFATKEGAAPATLADNQLNDALTSLVWKQLREIDGRHEPVLVNGSLRPLLLSVTSTSTSKLVITIVDRSADRVLAKLEPSISKSGEDFAAAVRAGMESLESLYEDASDNLQGTELSVDIVRTALKAQGHQHMDAYLSGGAAAYVDFDGNGLLNHPAAHLRVGADFNVLPWFLIGPSLSFDTTRAESSEQAFVGDLADGTYSHNRLVGKTALQTVALMARATIRQQHGLVRPLGFVGSGAAYLDATLTDQHFIPVSGSDTLPINLINQRSGSSGWAPAVEFGGGVSFQVSERMSLGAQACFFKPFHHLTFVTELQGVNQAKPVKADFQSVQTVALEAAAGWHW